MSNYHKVLRAAKRACELFEGGADPETHEFAPVADEAAGTVELQGYVIHTQVDGPTRVTAETSLLGSYAMPVDAVVEVMGRIVAERTKRVLMEYFVAEDIDI